MSLAAHHLLVLPAIRKKPLNRQSQLVFFTHFCLFAGAGVAAALFNLVVFDFPLLSGAKVAVGFATAGLMPALDLSLEWEYRVIRQAEAAGVGGAVPATWYPQTRRFIVLAAAIIFFVAATLLLLLWRDILWLQSQQHAAEMLPELLNAVLGEVGFVMGVLLVLVMIAVFSYARNLRLLFGNQTRVLELVSQGRLDSKVPVVTSDEFAVIAGHTNVMIDRLVERERMSRGLELANQIQANLMPRSSPHLPGIQVFGASRFCDETGGDFYDFMVRDGADGEELVVMIGDVTGHGVGSALLMTSVRAYLRAHLLQHADLGEAIGRTNALLCRDVAGYGFFATAFVLAYNPATCLVRWVGAGHDSALFLAADRQTCLDLQGHDIPMGVDPQWRYTVFEQTLASGIVLLGTDGIWEAMNGEGEMFGRDRLRQVLIGCTSAAPEDIINRIFAEIDDFTGAARIDDDRTAVIARLTELPAP